MDSFSGVGGEGEGGMVEGGGGGATVKIFSVPSEKAFILKRRNLLPRVGGVGGGGRGSVCVGESKLFSVRSEKAFIFKSRNLLPKGGNSFLLG